MMRYVSMLLLLSMPVLGNKEEKDRRRQPTDDCQWEIEKCQKTTTEEAEDFWQGKIDACWAANKKRKEGPLPKSIAYSAAVCAYQKRAQAASRGSGAAARIGTIRGKIRSEDLQQGAKNNGTLAARVRQAAAKERVRLLGCGDRRVAPVAACISYLDPDADCEGPQAEYIDVAAGIMEDAMNQ